MACSQTEVATDDLLEELLQHTTTMEESVEATRQAIQLGGSTDEIAAFLDLIVRGFRAERAAVEMLILRERRRQAERN